MHMYVHAYDRLQIASCRSRVADRYYLGCDRGGFVFECRAAGRCVIVFVLALLGFILV